MLRRGPVCRTAATSTGYGAATGEGVASTLGFKTTEAQDVVSFRVTGAGLDEEWGHGGRQAIQSEGAGLATAEDRGRHVLPLPGDRTLHVGRYGGLPAAFVLTPAGQLDETVGENGILELPNDDRRAVLRSGAVARRQARRADNQQQRGRARAGAPRAQVAFRLVAPGRRARRHEPLPRYAARAAQLDQSTRRGAAGPALHSETEARVIETPTYFFDLNRIEEVLSHAGTVGRARRAVITRAHNPGGAARHGMGTSFTNFGT